MSQSQEMKNEEGENPEKSRKGKNSEKEKLGKQ